MSEVQNAGIDKMLMQVKPLNLSKTNEKYPSKIKYDGLIGIHNFYRC
jgi:hypothetical protein